MDLLVAFLTLVAGLADGLNPCSFSGLLVFASVTTVAIERSCHDLDPEAADFQRGRLLRYGALWIVALFTVYMLLGFGFLGGIHMLIAEGHWAGKAAAVVAVGMGLWMFRDYFSSEDAPLRLEPPKHLRVLTGKYLRVLTYPGILVAGFLVGLCTVPCSGGIYVSVLAMLSTQETAVGMALLIAYNVMFVLPLVLVLAVATNRRTFRSVARWQVNHRDTVKFVLGATMITLGLFTLFLLA